MYRVIFLILLFSPFYSFCQVKPSQLLDNYCSLNTDTLVKAKGLNLKFFYPCDWEISEGQRPNVVKTFSYVIPKDTMSANITFTVKNLHTKSNKSQADRLYTIEYLKEVAEDLGKYINGRKVVVDGWPAGETEIELTREVAAGKMTMYMVNYLLVYEDKTISVIYGIGGLNPQKAKEYFDKYKLVFKAYFFKTVILSQYS